ncbi:DMT family transporter [Candidatus Protochlamydia phocaeensis]|uniref:DMT family transporter n=1 Tax=Candidatus Protochlamydia phocaeensis TaxID=1414722 RepID=UPI000838A6AA|nr:multidrug efflux SMR transporter [Candidatus Protochlamydia phocaeensis]
MAWIWLILAGLLEVGWAIGLRYTEGFSKLIPSLLTLSLMAASFFLLSQALETIPMGTAYAVWTGIGSLGVALAGIFFFQESSDIWRLVCIGLIVMGVLGLKWNAA